MFQNTFLTILYVIWNVIPSTKKKKNGCSGYGVKRHLVVSFQL